MYLLCNKFTKETKEENKILYGFITYVNLPYIYITPSNFLKKLKISMKKLNNFLKFECPILKEEYLRKNVFLVKHKHEIYRALYQENSKDVSNFIFVITIK